jgi:hypothetical protein
MRAPSAAIVRRSSAVRDAARVITKLEATIAMLNRENDKVAQRVVLLTIVCAVGAVGQVILAAMALCR